jgi:hypothetical protein
MVMEVSLLPFFVDGPELSDVVLYARAKGFIPYDILGLHYRPLDGALAQADLCFVPEKGGLRSHHAYATPQQRDALDRRLRGSGQ